MNDLDYVRDLRADVPEAQAARLAAGRDRLTTSIAACSGPAAPRSLAGRRTAAAMLAVAAAVAAAVVAVAALSGGAPRPSLPAGTGQTKPVPLTLAARILRSAAVAAAANRAAEPAPGQWFYAKTVGYEYGQVPPTGVDNEWQTFDGSYSAYYAGGRLIVHRSQANPPRAHGNALNEFNRDATPLTAYRALAALPSAPRALLAVVAKQVAKVGAANITSPIQLYAPTNSSQVQFDYLVELMWNAVDGEPPAAEASIFNALADMPGVSVQQGITDAAGHQALGVSDDGGIEQLLLSPRTFAVVGMRILSTGTNPVHPIEGTPGPWPPKGAIVESDAIVELAPVARPGQR